MSLTCSASPGRASPRRAHLLPSCSHPGHRPVAPPVPATGGSSPRLVCRGGSRGLRRPGWTPGVATQSHRVTYPQCGRDTALDGTPGGPRPETRSAVLRRSAGGTAASEDVLRGVACWRKGTGAPAEKSPEEGRPLSALPSNQLVLSSILSRAPSLGLNVMKTTRVTRVPCDNFRGLH